MFFLLNSTWWDQSYSQNVNMIYQDFLHRIGLFCSVPQDQKIGTDINVRERITDNIITNVVQ
jgi:hypothetical protein